MIVTYLRSSSFNTFYLCQQQYLLSYVLGLPQKTNRKAELGTIVHKVLECLAVCKKWHQNNTLTAPIDDAVGALDPTYMDSESYVNGLVRRAYDHYTSKSENTFDFTHFKSVQDWVWKALKYNNGMFDPRKRFVVAPEGHFDFEIDESWASYDYGNDIKGKLALKGTIDLITAVRKSIYEVIDWKTGRRMSWSTGEEKDYSKLMQDPQLRMYHYALFKMYPDVDQFILTINYINDGGPFTLAFGKSDIPETKDLIRKAFEDIKRCSRPTLKSGGSHWFCTRICDYFKQPSPVEGVNMCNYIADKVRRDGIGKVINSCTHAGHSVSHYSNPGA